VYKNGHTSLQQLSRIINKEMLGLFRRIQQTFPLRKILPNLSPETLTMRNKMNKIHVQI
jgi:hypothetical protein